ncbi:MAG: CooT family nickel-binding protein [Candidatus Omnitrophica bacterium]|nr:CooT family nickel-binding protein [Candidatus Omnitrophota bacterium]
MCESNIVRRKAKKEEIIAEDIDFIRVMPNGKLLIKTVLGEERVIAGDIEEIDLHEHKVILKNIK